MQEERLRAYCATAGLDLVALLREEGVSGAKPLASRPRGAELLAMVAAGQVQHVVALKLDRLFRDAADCLNRTRDWDRAAVALHLVDLGGTINIGSALGRRLLTMAAGFAELERNLIAERTSAALQHMKKSGATLGRAPTGWRKVAGADGKETTLEKESAGQGAVARIHALRASGLPLQAIADRLTVEGVPAPGGGARWYKGTIGQIVRRLATWPYAEAARSSRG